jgi:2-oxoglutarate ferredoxin oxidoreductase subunit alpha
MAVSTEGQEPSHKDTIVLDGATVRLAGDSGDGMQVVGGQFTNTSALHGNDVATFPDFPAEIRAPRGTLAGVSGFQVQFSSTDIFTPGDTLNALVAMNPAALVTNIGDLEKGGILIVNSESFKPRDLKLARLDSNPLEDGSLDEYRVVKVRLDTLNRAAVKDIDGLSSKLQDRCKNFFALGLIYWLFGRSVDATLRFIDAKFHNKPEIAEANARSLRAGWY